MALVRERDAGAFEALYDAYYRVVYGIGVKMLGEAAAAEDLTQAVFLKIWTSPQAYREGNFGAWVSRVTRNRALDVLRGRAVRPESEIPHDATMEGSLDETVFAMIDGERVRAALATLPEEQRRPIELGFFGGITHEEIARRTQTPLGTIKTRIRTGLHKLRAALEGSAAR